MPVEGRYDGRGVLAEGSPRGASRPDIVRQVLEKLTQQLSLVCEWPADFAERIDVVGAYRFFNLEFAPRDQVSLYLQLWSEPGDPLLFEVSSGHQHAPTAGYLTQQMRDALLGRGFEIGGAAQNFRKKVVVSAKNAIRTLGREMLAITVEVLGYDGKVPLTFQMHQDSRLEPGRLFRGIQPDDFRRLLERWGIAAKFTSDGQPVINARSAGVRFVVKFHAACAPPFSRFEIVTFESGIEVKGEATRIANEINASLTTGRAVAVVPQRVALSLTLVAGGGVAPDNLRRQVLGWVEQVRKIVKGTLS